MTNAARQLAAAVEARVGAGGYVPADTNRHVDRALMPKTVRELIDWQDDQDKQPDCCREPEPFAPNVSALEPVAGRMDLSPRPIDWRALQQKRCRPPQRVQRRLPALLDWQPLCRAFWRWCEKYLPENRRPDIDHSTARAKGKWPLLQQFYRQLKKHGGYTVEDLFGWGFGYEYDNECQVAYLPLYCLEDCDDYVPAAEFLDGFVHTVLHGGHGDGWPEGAYSQDEEQITQDERSDTALEVFRHILQANRLRLLPPLWRTACRALAAYPAGWHLCFFDYDQVQFVMADMDADDMQNFFEVLVHVSRMTTAVNPLLNTFSMDARQSWQSVIDHLYAARRHFPELKVKARPAQSKTLIEVLT